MEDFYMNITSQNNSYDYSKITYDYSNITSNYSNITSNYGNITSNYGNITSNYSNISSNYSNITSNYGNITFNYSSITEKLIIDALTCLTIGVGLPLTLVAIYALYSQVRNGYVAPIYVINLLVSDLIQLCCMIIWVETLRGWKIPIHFKCVYYAALMVSVCFMVCIALERYLVVAHPLWYRCRRTIKISVVVCVLVWVIAPTTVLTFIFCVQSQVRYITLSVVLLLPLPLFIFFLGGVLKALSASISVPSDEKRRIVGVLVLVLLIYTLLFLPCIILHLALATYDVNLILSKLSFLCLQFNPLADLTLYIFMRKGTIDKLLSSVQNGQ